MDQQMADSQARPIMTTVPTIITTKDCSYLKDELSWLLVVMKKCAHFEKECQDSAIKTAINKIGQMHERHYNLLLKHLQTNNTQAMQHIPQQNQPQ